MGRNVRLEQAVCEDERQQREKQNRLERHHEVAERHQAGADDDGSALAQHAVGEQPAEDGRQINERRVGSVNLRGERLRFERAENRFKAAFQCEKADHLRGMTGQKHIFHEVEHEQRAHPIIGEALPHLGREQEGKCARVAEKLLGFYF